jgi:hypothetical protein
LKIYLQKFQPSENFKPRSTKAERYGVQPQGERHLTELAVGKELRDEGFILLHLQTRNKKLENDLALTKQTKS